MDVAKHLADMNLSHKSGAERAAIRRRSTRHVWWNGQLFRRAKSGLLVVVAKGEQEKVLRSLHDELGHWDIRATQLMIADRFWWPGVNKDVARYVKTCDVCQRTKNEKKYFSDLFVPQSRLLDVFSIDFAGPFQQTIRMHWFLLVCVEHLTGWPIVRAT